MLKGVVCTLTGTLLYTVGLPFYVAIFNTDPVDHLQYLFYRNEEEEPGKTVGGLQ